MLFGPGLFAVDLKERTVSGFDRYVKLTEQRMAADEGKGNFLVVDRLSPSAKVKAYEQLRAGQLYIEQEKTTDDGHKVSIPEGMTHDWVGIVFIPHANLLETLSFLQDADHYEEIFRPAVRRSHLVSWGENQMKLSEQFYSKTVVTVVENVEFDAHYTFPDPNHLVCLAHSTRVAEVSEVGTEKEHELPEGTGRGFLWRINSYWHIEQKDGGVYLQVETLALTRSVPAAFEWMVAPFLKSVPKGTMSTFLTTSRTHVGDMHAQNAGQKTDSPKPDSPKPEEPKAPAVQATTTNASRRR
jgi:hypothetical protein